MGWSCSAKASAVLQVWSDACFAQSGMSNVYLVSGKETFKYMFEVSNKEHNDGAITGKILRFVSETHVVNNGSFRIEPDGVCSRAPAFLKEAAKKAKSVIGDIGSGG
jgi:hypothetical protein